MFMSLSTLHNSCYNYITRLVSGNIYASIQNTKYALLSLAEFVEIYALFGRTKQTQNLCAEDQIQFLGLGLGGLGKGMSHIRQHEELPEAACPPQTQCPRQHSPTRRQKV